MRGRQVYLVVCFMAITAARTLSFIVTCHVSQVPEHSLPLLAAALEERTEALPRALATGGDVSLLFEDLHWLLLLAAHTLTEHEPGEAPLVPPELMRHSCAQANFGTVDRQLSLRLLYDMSVQPSLLPADRLDDLIRSA